MKTAGISITLILGLVLGYFLLAPVPIDPQAWQSPANPGYSGQFAVNDKLAGLDQIDIGEWTGPEDVVLDNQGRIYVSVHEGRILRLNADGTNREVFAETGGRPLGLAFDQQGNLIVADAFLGLLSISPSGVQTLLTNKLGESPILYANNLDIASDGTIYFTDASMKFGAKQWGGSYPASLLDLMEHGGHGRVLSYSPADNKTKLIYQGLNFANGLALASDEQSVLVNETGNYRVVRVGIAADNRGALSEVIGELPAFPDNLNRGLDGKYWVGLVSPRNPLLDKISGRPFLRKIVQRLPQFIRPKATYYGHVIAINEAGEVLQDLQDPSGGYATTTGVFETPDYLYVGSLLSENLGRMQKQ
ncbi:SMP-30/gluconolactonase/LRE family protein [Microbulbifer agarilyticus]|uniref:SMP-30/gluconolactonase/LRE family protein n=1 Tax=Microbulbifer agarilyticus TaxID=260552 RepID=UPI001CD36AFA|nr:SMP-30/gluconolactonase/LRE family protein [Microbulbifer agarilyticus]MCA0893919.1 SMP-30/gluconolactonase/LRE family protein [Microbulbifer agarilyticus]